MPATIIKKVLFTGLLRRALLSAGALSGVTDFTFSFGTVGGSNSSLAAFHLELRLWRSLKLQ